MGMPEALTPRALTGVLKAMADETRLKILALLLEQPELCVCHFEQILEINASLNTAVISDLAPGNWPTLSTSTTVSSLTISGRAGATSRSSA